MLKVKWLCKSKEFVSCVQIGFKRFMACPNEYQEYLIARRFSSSQIFFTADTHFGHANIIKYCHRPFATVEEMDDALVRNWNAVVSPDATVFHLGDFALDSKERWLDYKN